MSETPAPTPEQPAVTATPAAPVAPLESAAPPAPEPVADWRAEWASGDEKALARLQRFTTPADVWKSYTELEKRFSENGRVRVPTAQSTPEEVAEWNRARGVPDSPDGYKIDVTAPEGLELGDTEKNTLATLRTELHKLGADPTLVNFAHKFYYDQLVESTAQLEANAVTAVQDAERTLKSEWGRDYDENVRWGNAAVQQFGLSEFINSARLADGTPLNSHPQFVKAMAKIGRMNAEDPFFLAAAGKGAAETPEARKSALMQLRLTDPKRYASPEVQAEIEQINTALERRQQLAR